MPEFIGVPQIALPTAQAAFQFNYDEDTPKRSVSPGGMSGSVRRLRMWDEFWLDVAGGSGPEKGQPLVPALRSSLTELLGTTDVNAGNGQLRRTLPPAHPFFPWMVVDGIGGLEKRGDGVRVGADISLEVPPLPYGALWNAYKVRLEFAAMPYGMLPDYGKTNGIPGPSRNISWTDTDGTTQKYADSFEYLRFTDWDRKATNESITATVASQGAMKFADGAVTGQYPGMPRLFLPDGILKFRWRAVPYRYLVSPNCLLDKYKGRVNQQGFYAPTTAGPFKWAAGSLLYVDYSYDAFTPPVPQMSPYVGTVNSSPKLVDIEFTFMHTTRTPAVAVTPANANHVAAGFNLWPHWSDLKYHYCTLDGTANGVPLYRSFPLQVLFWDPDVAMT